MTKPHKYAVGETFERWTPFILEDRELFDTDSDGGMTRTVKSWRPGVRYELVYPDDAEPVWDGEGLEIRTIVGICQIDGGGTRVLYRRQWRKPDGKVFGKKTVRMTTPSGFTTWRRDQPLGIFAEDTMRAKNNSVSLAMAGGAS